MYIMKSRMIYSVLNFFLFWMKFTSTSDCARNHLRSKIQSHIKMILYQPKRHQRYLNVGNFFIWRMMIEPLRTQLSHHTRLSKFERSSMIIKHLTVSFDPPHAQRKSFCSSSWLQSTGIYGQFWEYILENDTPVL